MEPCPMPRSSSARFSARCWAIRCLTGWVAALAAGSAGYCPVCGTPPPCRVGGLARRPPETVKLLAAAAGRRRCRSLADPRMRFDIRVHMRRHRLRAVEEKVIGAGDLAVIDLDVALMRQLVNQLLDRLGGDQ